MGEKMKKILFSIGSIAAVAAPIAAVVSCNDNTSSKWREVSGAEGLANVVNAFAKKQLPQANFKLTTEDAQKILTGLKKQNLEIQVFRDLKDPTGDNVAKTPGWLIVVKGVERKYELSDTSKPTLIEKSDQWNVKDALIANVKDVESVIRILSDGTVQFAPVATNVVVEKTDKDAEKTEFGITKSWTKI